MNLRYIHIKSQQQTRLSQVKTRPQDDYHHLQSSRFTINTLSHPPLADLWLEKQRKTRLVCSVKRVRR